MKLPPFAVALLLAITSLDAQPVKSRADFAKAMANVKIGMPSTGVEKLLGKPDDIRTQEDAGGPDPGSSKIDTKEIWAYGTSGHMGFATLGCVFFDVKSRAQIVYGGEGAPPDPEMLPEVQLADLLRLIDTAPGLRQDFDTLQLIRVVNGLQPLGKEKALAAIDEYLRVAPERVGAREGLFFVLRALFEIPKDTGFMPPMRIGAFIPAPPEDLLLCPRFPMVLEGDIPLILTTNSMLAGAVEPVSRHVKFFREHGTMRSRPLHPPDDPLAALARLEKSPQWIYRDTGKENEEWGRTFVTNQLLSLVRTVYRPVSDPLKEMNFSTFDEQRWRRSLEEFPKLGAHWDVAQNCYVFANGSTLPDPKPALYRRVIWKIPSLGSDALVIVERINPWWINTMIYKSAIMDRSFPDSRVRIAEPGGGTLVHFKVSEGDRGRTYSAVPLEAGRKIQFTLLSGKKKIDSPIFTP